MLDGSFFLLAFCLFLLPFTLGVFGSATICILWHSGVNWFGIILGLLSYKEENMLLVFNILLFRESLLESVDFKFCKVFQLKCIYKNLWSSSITSCSFPSVTRTIIWPSRLRPVLPILCTNLIGECCDTSKHIIKSTSPTSNPSSPISDITKELIYLKR